MHPQKQAGVATLISAKENFESKLVRRGKECHFILIKGTIHQEDSTFVNIYALNINAPNFIKETLLDIKFR
jgi:hypothetical protein